MAEGDAFFSRWSRRKGLARDGIALAEPAVPAPEPPAVPPAVPPAAITSASSTDVNLEAAPEATPHQAVTTPPPTLADVAALTAESDYSRFVAQGVAPGVKNAALKKLFTDPRFNVMDGLDTYIEDYGLPDPLPPGMLEKMVQSRSLRLFDDIDPPAEPAVDPDANPNAHPDAHPSPATADPVLASQETTPDEDPDLRLQPDDAAGRAGAAQRTVEDAGRQH